VVGTETVVVTEVVSTVVVCRGTVVATVEVVCVV
jgi:hypothetical protein